VPDPISDLFGIPAMELFASKELVVQHGTLDRFPAFMRAGLMETVESLCRGYAGPLQVSNGSVTEGVQIDVAGAHASALLRLGLTVYFIDLDRSLPDSRPWLRDLEVALGLPECASLAAFANAPGSGLSLHHDRFDQLFFQIRGEKTFRYAPNGFVENPDVQFSPCGAAQPDWAQTYRHGFPLTVEEVLARGLTTVTLSPGSAFFMPAGTWHTTAGQDRESVSLIVVVRAPSRLEIVLNLLRHYAAQSPEWRARSYGGWAVPGRAMNAERQKLTTLMADLAERLPALPARDAYGAWWSEGFTTGTQGRYPLECRFERYVRLPNSSVRYEGTGPSGLATCVVRSGPMDRPQAETVLAISDEVRPVVDWVLHTHAAFSVEDACKAFDGCARSDLETLFAWLSHAALIRPLPAPEWGRGPADPLRRD
jgi:50S ribosomal protein L16 3-hydroxylase